MKKVVLISGGSDGLGKEAARALAVGSQVVILARNEDRLKATAAEIGCDHVVADVRDYDSVESAVNQVIKKYGQIDCLINNAGIWIEGALNLNEATAIKDAMEINALGVIYVAKAVVPVMKEKGAGLIINVISDSGLTAKKEKTVYCASKWAVTGFTKSLEAELAPYGIRVSGFYPGKMRTGFFAKKGVTKSFDNALELAPAVRALKFLVESEDDVVIPSLEIKSIKG